MNKRLIPLSLTALAAGVVLTGCGSPAPAPAVHATGTPACGGAVVVTTMNGREGYGVFVRSPGPDVIQVDLNSESIRDHRRSTQQVTSRSDGASFDFGRSATPNSITVNTRRNGACTAPIPAPIW